MTPDESAWAQCAAAVLAQATKNYDATESARIAAECADAMLAELRKRREVCPKCERPAPLDLPHLCAPLSVRERLSDDAFESLVRHEGTWHEAGRPQNTAETQFAQEARRARASERAWESKWLQATMRAQAADTEADRFNRMVETVKVERNAAEHEASEQSIRAERAERERDEAREANKRLAADRNQFHDAMCGAKREWEAATKGRDEQRARAEAAEHQRNTDREVLREVQERTQAHDKERSEAFRELESLLKEALGNLCSWRDGGCIVESTIALLAKAKAAGYGVEP